MRKPRTALQSMPSIDYLKQFCEITESNCYLWRYSTSAGYGALKTVEGRVKLHRYVCEIEHGKPEVGQLCLHSCDNRACINPDHLRWGTYKDNWDDAKSRNRHTHGELNGHSKLKAIDIKAIYEMRNAGMTLQAIANNFKVTRQAIWFVLQGKTWKESQPKLEGATK